MAFHITKYVDWKAGPGTPVKYDFYIDADVDVTNFEDSIATISVVGTATISNHPTNSRNSFAASDFAILVPGNINISAHPFVHGTSYYEAPLPFLPDPQNGDKDKMLIEFRGDTWASDPNNNNNKSSLWIKGQGLVVNQLDQEASRQFNLNLSFDLPIETTGNTTVLAWDSSGADNSTTYDWLNRQIWASWFDLVWEATVNYNANGGSGAPSPQTKTTSTTHSTATFTIPNTTPTWGAYEFLGWSTVQHTGSSTEADVEYRPGDTISVSQSSPTVTLYAVWRKDYRPGCVYDNSVWQSHNRPNGECHVYNGSKYLEMRTIGAPTAMGNPPSVYHNNKWYNMARIGLNGA